MTTEQQSESKPQAPPGEASQSAGRPRGGARLAIGLALLAMLGVGGGLLAGYRYWSDMRQQLQRLDASLAQAAREQQEMGTRLRQTYQDLAHQREQIAAQEQAMARQRQRLEEERASMRQQGRQMDRSLAEMRQRLGGEKSQWRVAEAEYLLSLANQRLRLAGDPATALEALTGADERLRDSGDPGWSGVRKTLAREMAELQALPQVDQAGLYARLGALEQRLDQLTPGQGVLTPSAHAAAAQAGEAGQAEGFDLQRLWHDLWEGFKSLVVVRHHERPVAAMLPPSQGYFLVQNLRLKLEAAKAALLGRNAQLYGDSLRSAQAWLERYFDQANPQVAAFQGELSQLARQEIAPQLPDISASLRELQARREQLAKETPP